MLAVVNQFELKSEECTEIGKNKLASTKLTNMFYT